MTPLFPVPDLIGKREASRHSPVGTPLGSILRRISLCFLLMGATPALATPDRSTHSDDQLIAATQDSIFVLRTVTDNLGSYYSALVDRHLVEIDIDSGAAGAVYPARRLRVNHLIGNDDRIPGQVTERLGETSDMTAILRNAQAEPMVPNRWQMGQLRLEEGQLFSGDTLVLTNFGIRAAARAQLGRLRDIYPVIETEEAYAAHQQIDLYDLYVEGDWPCEMDNKAVLLRRLAGALRVVKLTCTIAETESTVSFHVFAPEDI